MNTCISQQAVQVTREGGCVVYVTGGFTGHRTEGRGYALKKVVKIGTKNIYKREKENYKFKTKSQINFCRIFPV